MDSRDPPATPRQSQQQQQSQSQLVGPPSSYNHGLHNNISNTSSQAVITSNSSAAMTQNYRFPLNSAAPPAVEGLSSPFGDGSLSPGMGPSGFSIEPARKKRGRPRKYSPDGNIALGLAPNPSPSLAPVTPFSSSVVVGHENSGGGTPSSQPQTKKSRGRPAGSGKKQLDALGSSGVGFTPHVILVKAGEDVASKIMAFSQQGPRTVCILSANGAICNVTLRQPSMSGSTVTYEGRFEIISLSGSFLLSESNGSRSRTGGLTVSLAGSDGRVLGGGVAGMLTAATPVQVIVGSFMADGKKSKSGISPAPLPNMATFGAPAAAMSPLSQGASSESSDENGGSPLNPGSAPYNNSSHPIRNVGVYSNMAWGNSTVKMFPS